MKIFALISIIILAYLYSINFNDIKSVIEPGNVCPPKTIPKAIKRTGGQGSGKFAAAIAQQEELLAKEEERKAAEKDRIAREKMFQKNGKPCHERVVDAKTGNPADALDQLLRGWGWY